MNKPADNVKELAPVAPKSLVRDFAHKFGVEEDKMLNTLKKTCFSQGNNKPEVSNEQMMALLVVADQHDLNPFTREIYAFPQNGGIVPIVGIDGWLRIINSHPQFDGMEFDEKMDSEGKKPISCTCKIYRKDRKHPIEVTEYLSECYKSTDPWNNKPVRMLRHKATIQCGRYAFSFSGIYDEDDAKAIKDAGSGGVGDVIDLTDTGGGSMEFLDTMDDEKFALELDKWKAAVLAQKKTAEDILNTVSTKYALTDAQIESINKLGELN